MIPRRSLWLRWIIANSLGEVVGLGVVGAGGYLVTTRIGEEPSPPAAIGGGVVVVLLGALEGGVVGSAQWLVLRRPLPALRARAWVIATVVGAVAAWLIGMIPSSAAALGGSGNAAAREPPAAAVLVLAALLGIVAGVILASPQWLVLRRQVRAAGWWLPANAAAWMVGMPIIFAAVGAIPEGAGAAVIVTGMLLTLAVTGAAVGAIHGAVLVRLLP